MKINFETTLPLITKEKAIEYYSNHNVCKEESVALDVLLKPYLDAYVDSVEKGLKNNDLNAFSKELGEYHNKFGLFVDLSTGKVSVFQKDNVPKGYVILGYDSYMFSKGLEILLFKGLDSFRKFIYEDNLWRLTSSFLGGLSKQALESPLEQPILEKEVFSFEKVKNINIEPLVDTIHSKVYEYFDRTIGFEYSKCRNKVENYSKVNHDISYENTESVLYVEATFDCD